MADFAAEQSRSGLLTCRVGSTWLHSRYDPQKEALRFAQSADASFIPRHIIIGEPALSYCAAPLRARFPSASLCAVRFDRRFEHTDRLWDRVLYADSDLADAFFSYMGEDGLSAALFLEWKPSASVWQTDMHAYWSAAQSAAKKGRDLIATRAYFSRRWLLNTARFCLRISRASRIVPGNKPLVLTASGPSLSENFASLKRYRSSFFLLCVSSAYAALAAAGIRADAVISCDGGYWAKKHLSRLLPPLIVSAEAAIPAHLFNASLTPLIYGDGTDSAFLRACAIPAMQAERNGTVSGTAAALALSLTAGRVYACGLDLKTGRGFQHSQPNELEIDDSLKDRRLIPAQTRTFFREASSEALSIYRNWFIAHSHAFASRFFRITDAPPLGAIQSYSWKEFAEYEAGRRTEPPVIREQRLSNRRERFASLSKLFSQMEDSIRSPDSLEGEAWLSAIAPAELLAYRRSLDKEAAKEGLCLKAQAALEKLRERSLHEYQSLS